MALQKRVAAVAGFETATTIGTHSQAAPATAMRAIHNCLGISSIIDRFLIHEYVCVCVLKVSYDRTYKLKKITTFKNMKIHSIRKVEKKTCFAWR